MQTLLNKIIEMDEKAREMTLEAEKAKERSEQEIEKLKNDIYNDYITRAKERVEKNIAVDREQAQAHRDAFRKKVDAVKAELTATYKNNADKWVDEIVQNVIG